MKIAELYDRFVLKYGQDTMRAPTLNVQEKPISSVVEIPSSGKAPITDSKPSYDDLYIQRPNKIDPLKALNVILERFGELELFTAKELQTYKKLIPTKGPQQVFKALKFETEKRLFQSETCLQIVKNYGQYIQ